MNMENTTQKYIIRTDRAGVFYAEIAERRGSAIDLVNARRIWKWHGATECIGIATSGIAKSSKVTAPIAAMTVIGVIEVLPVSPEAFAILEAHPSWTL